MGELTATEALRAYRIKEAAELVGCTPRHLYKLIGAGEIAAFAIGKRGLRIRAQEIDRFKIEGRRPVKKKRVRHDPSQPRRPLNPPYVYFLNCGHYTKIGFTASGRVGRLESLQAATPYRLYLWAYCPGGRETERELHKVFARQRYRGEWFELLLNSKAEVKQEVLQRGGEVMRVPDYV